MRRTSKKKRKKRADRRGLEIGAAGTRRCFRGHTPTPTPAAAAAAVVATMAVPRARRRSAGWPSYSAGCTRSVRCRYNDFDTILAPFPPISQLHATLHLLCWCDLTWHPCASGDDWCLQSHIIPALGLQAARPNATTLALFSADDLAGLDARYQASAAEAGLDEPFRVQHIHCNIGDTARQLPLGGGRAS